MALRFEIEAGGIREEFESADVPKTTVAPADHAHGSGYNPHAYVRPGIQSNEPFRLSRNFHDSDRLWDWRKKVVDGITPGKEDYKKNGTLTQYDHDGVTAIAHWDFTGAWISEWVIDPDLDAFGNELLKEQIVVVADVVERKDGGGPGRVQALTQPGKFPYANNRRKFPYSNNKFRVDIEGIKEEVARVKRVSGLDSKTEVVTVRMGAHARPRMANPLTYRPGRTTYTDIAIERYLVDQRPVLQRWWDEYRQGKVSRRAGSIFILNDDYSDAVQLDFFGALPKDYNSGSRAAFQDDFPTETLVLQIEELTKK